MNIDQKIDWLYQQLTTHVGQLQEQLNAYESELQLVKEQLDTLKPQQKNKPVRRGAGGRPRQYTTIGARLRGTIKKYGKDLRQDGTIWMSHTELCQRADRPETPYSMISKIVDTMVQEGELVKSRNVDPNRYSTVYVSVAQ